MSTYEELRQQKIARNNAILETLGLIDAPIAKARSLQKPKQSSISKKRKRGREFVSVPARSSNRLKDQATKFGDNVSNPSTLQKPSFEKETVSYSYMPLIPTYATEVLNDGAVERPQKGSTLWDPKRKHQHLQVSESHRTVVTTGCAGYGAVLATRESGVEVTANKKGRGKEWKVEVVQEGAGGFAVGVSMASACTPFKSLGNRPDSWVLHSDGTLMHNRHKTSLDSSTHSSRYEKGDCIGIVVSPNGNLCFAINDQMVDSGIILASGTYLLCCQPYMGGAARLL